MRLGQVCTEWIRSFPTNYDQELLAAQQIRFKWHPMQNRLPRPSRMVSDSKTWSTLRIDEAAPFCTTPNHRIMVPSPDGDDATVKAKDLKVESWVMCSDRVAKKVLGIELIPAAWLQTYIILAGWCWCVTLLFSVLPLCASANWSTCSRGSWTHRPCNLKGNLLV